MGIVQQVLAVQTSFLPALAGRIELQYVISSMSLLAG